MTRSSITSCQTARSSKARSPVTRFPIARSAITRYPKRLYNKVCNNKAFLLVNGYSSIFQKPFTNCFFCGPVNFVIRMTNRLRFVWFFPGIVELFCNRVALVVQFSVLITHMITDRIGVHPILLLLLYELRSWQIMSAEAEGWGS